jgi:hypothetical protein
MSNPQRAAAHVNVAYVRRIVRAVAPALAARLAPYLAKVDEEIDGAVVAAADAPAGVPATPHDPILTPGATSGIWAWSDVAAGAVPTGTPSQDDYGDLQQQAEVAGGRRDADPGTPLDWSDQNDAIGALRQSIIGVVGQGERYYPSAVYPPIPAWAFEAAGVVTPDAPPTAADVSALVAGYQHTIEVAGEPVVERPEQTVGPS